MLNCDYKVIRHGKRYEDRENYQENNVQCPECTWVFNPEGQIIKATKKGKLIECCSCLCQFEIKIRKW